MSELTNHLINSILQDAEALCKHGGLTRQNRILIETILKNPSRDYDNHAPPSYTLTKSGSDVSMADRPFLPPRPVNESSRPSVPSRPGTTDSKDPGKPSRPPVPASSKPNNDKLSSQYRSEQEKKPSGQNAQNGFAAKLGNQAAMSGASGLGFGVGMGLAGKML